jgi:hypothetical protein
MTGLICSWAQRSLVFFIAFIMRMIRPVAMNKRAGILLAEMGDGFL